jgi:hypothetical protein
MMGDLPLSEGAKDVDDHVRDLVSDLTDFDVRSDKPRRLSDLTNWCIAMAYFLLVVAVLYASGTLSSDPAFTVSTGPGVVTTGAPADAASTQSDPATSVVNTMAGAHRQTVVER